MANPFSKLSWIVLICLVWVAVVSCTANPPPTPAPNEPLTTVRAMATIAKTSTPTIPPPNPTPAFNPTELPFASPTPKPTSTRAPTLTPLPTVPPEDVELFLTELLENDTNCPLPCWWGITPGKTLWSEARNFLATFAERFEVTGLGGRRALHEVYVFSQSLNRQVGYEFIVFDNTVVAINVHGYQQIWCRDYSSKFHVSEILEMYGPTREVWIQISRDIFRVILFYPDQGIMVRFTTDGSFRNGQIIGCPQDKNEPDLWLFIPNTNVTFVETVEIVASSYDFGSENYLALEEATDMDVETFYETFKEADNTTCLITPSELW